MGNSIRLPRVRVLAGDIELAGLLSAEVHSNNHFASDRFRLRAAGSSTELLSIGPDDRLRVMIGLDDIWRDILVGIVDSICLDPVQDVIDLEGRDLSSLLIDSQIAEAFPNRTSSEIATELAQRHGLSANVDRTSTPIGRYYQSEHEGLTLGQFAKTTTEWDLLAHLATQEGFDLFMDGEQLSFAAPRADRDVDLRISDVVHMRMRRCVNLARPVEVQVNSWSSKTAKMTTAVSRRSGVGTVSKREISRPNLPLDDAQKLADRVVGDLKRHEWTIDVSMPGELGITPRSRVALVGSGTDWDRSYVVNQVTRHLDPRRGFTQELSLQGTV